MEYNYISKNWMCTRRATIKKT